MTNSFVLNEDIMTVFEAIPDDMFDIAVCDVPYGINVAKMHYLTEKKYTTRQNNGAKQTAYKNKRIHKFKNWDSVPPTQKYFDELCRISKNQIIFGIDYMKWKNVGTGRIIWDKQVSRGVSFKGQETAYCSFIDHIVTIPLLWDGMRQAKSLSEPTTHQGNKRLNEKRIHPCQKPVLLYDAIFRMFAKPEMSVIDTHLGSGSSRISADKFGIELFVGYEADQEHYNDQEKRWKQYKSQQKLPFGCRPFLQIDVLPIEAEINGKQIL